MLRFLGTSTQPGCTVPGPIAFLRVPHSFVVALRKLRPAGRSCWSCFCARLVPRLPEKVLQLSSLRQRHAYGVVFHSSRRMVISFLSFQTRMPPNSTLTVSSPVVGCRRHCANPTLWLHLRDLCADTEQEMLRPISWYSRLVRFCVFSLAALLSCCACSVCGGQLLCTSVRRSSASEEFAVWDSHKTLLPR